MMYAGEYSIEVKYFGQPVAGSPFTAKAWDTNKVTVSNVIAGRVGLQSSFNSESLFLPVTTELFEFFSTLVFVLRRMMHNEIKKNNNK